MICEMSLIVYDTSLSWSVGTFIHVIILYTICLHFFASIIFQRKETICTFIQHCPYLLIWSATGSPQILLAEFEDPDSLGSKNMTSTCQIGAHHMAVGPGKEVQFMSPATELLGQRGMLKKQLQEDGYLYLQQVLPKDLVSAARQAVLAALESSGMVLKGQDGKLNPDVKCDTDQGAVPASLARCPEMLALVESDALKRVMQEILDADVETLDHKWLRAVGQGENSGFHTDSVYLNKGSREGLTCWIPLGDVDLSLGGLCVVGRSHCDARFARVRQTYSEIDVETAGISGTGWFSEDPHEILSYGCPLLTSSFRMTDLVVFRLDTMHGSLSNGSQPGEIRISCDTRWYASNDPSGIDARYMGENPIGTAKWWVNRHNKEMFPTSMDEAKIAWGLGTSWLVLSLWDENSIHICLGAVPHFWVSFIWRNSDRGCV